MSIYNIAMAAADHLVGRLARRALLALAMSAFSIVAIYHFTVAGTLKLEAYFSELHAQLIVAGIYTAFAAASFAILWATGRKTHVPAKPVVGKPREMKLAVLVEAAMLGYSMARKSERTK